MYAFLLTWIINAEERSGAAPGSSMPVPGGKGRGKGKSKKGGSDGAGADWDWEAKRESIVISLSNCFEGDVDHGRIWKLGRPEPEFINMFVRAAFLVLEKATGARDKNSRQYVHRLVSLIVQRFPEGNHIDDITTSTVHQVRKSEAAGVAIAELMQVLVTEYKETRLVGEVIREIAHLDFKTVAQDAEGAKSLSSFVCELSERVPAVVLTKLSLLTEHLGGESYQMRNGVVYAVGRLLHLVLAEAGEQGAAVRESLLQLLIDRIRDINGFTRAKVLQTWSYLCEHKALPVRLWPQITSIAIGRLEDKTAIVRKNAIQLLTILLQWNPFGSALLVVKFRAKVEDLERSLAEQEAAVREAISAMQTERGGAALATQATRNASNSDEDEEDMQGLITQVPEINQEINSPKLVELRKDLMIQQLGMDFIIMMQHAMPIASAMLASKTSGDVTEIMELFVTAHKFRLENVDEGVRKMLMLVWSKEAGIKESVLDAFKRIYLDVSLGQSINGLAIPEELMRKQEGLLIASNLISLVSGANLGEMTSLEELVTEMVRKGAISPYVIQAWWDIFALKVRGSVREHSRNAIILLSMAANADPSMVRSNLNLLVSVGFGPRSQDDEIIAKYTCMCLQKLAKTGSKSVDSKLPSNHPIFRKLAKLINGSSLRLGGWFPAAEQAINAIYCLNMCPEDLCSDVIKSMADVAFHKPTETASQPLPQTSPTQELAPATGQESSEAATTSVIAMADSDGQAISQSQEVNSSQPESSTAGSQDSIAASSQDSSQASQQDARMTIQPDTSTASPPESSPVLEQETNASSQGSSQMSKATSAALSRLFFVLGHVALKHLVYMEEVANNIKKRREGGKESIPEPPPAVEDSSNDESDDDDGGKKKKKGAKSKGKKESDEPQSSQKPAPSIEEDLGIVAGVADAEEEALREIVERELVGKSLLGAFGPIIARVCEQPRRFSDPTLKASAALALCKFMCVSSEFCDKYLQLLFSLLKDAKEAGTRANIMIALGDIAFRFPNLVEPWTEHVYARLRDSDIRVRKNALMVLTHLILNDMIKVKGQISEMAVCLEDPEKRISDLAHLFFHELAHKGNSPVYNLLPDLVGRLSADPSVTPEAFRNIMKYVMGFIEKDKQVESMYDKLCNRFATTEDVMQWRDISFCLSMLNCNDKCVKKLSDLYPIYSKTLLDEHVFESFRTLITKAKKTAKADVKLAVDELEAKLNSIHLQQVEDQAAADKAAHAAKKAGGSRKKAPAHVIKPDPDGDDGNSDESPHHKENINPTQSQSSQPQKKGRTVLQSKKTAARAQAQTKAKGAAGGGKKKAPQRKKVSSSEEEEDDQHDDDDMEDVAPAPAVARKTTQRGKAAAATVAVKREEEQDESEEEEKEKERQPLSTQIGAKAKGGSRPQGRRKMKVDSDEDDD